MSQKTKLMEYTVTLDVKQMNISEKVREKIIQRMSDKRYVEEAVKVLAINQSFIKRFEGGEVSEEPKSVYEELSRIVCGIRTKVKFGKLEGKIISPFIPVKFTDACNTVRTILAEFLLCIFSGNKCIDCGKAVSKVIKEMNIPTLYPYKINIDCLNNKVNISVIVYGD